MSHKCRVNTLASSICRKGLNSDVCHACIPNNGCRVTEKSDEQLDYALSSIKDSIYLKACPGSGKTEVIGLKSAYEIKRWDRISSGIAVLTFTNNAASVITDRICQFSGADKVGFPHFIGTIDSWLHGYIGHPFSNQETGYLGKDGDRSFFLVDESDYPQNDKKSFLFAHKLKTPFVSKSSDQRGFKTMPLFANNIRFDGNWEIRNPFSKHNEYILLEDFYKSDAFTAYKNEPGSSGKPKSWLTKKVVLDGFDKSKNKFNKQGHVTYHDIERICLEVLSKNEKLATLFAKRFPLVIVDECQDLSVTQLSIFKALMNKGTHLHFIGDIDQAIYEFKKVEPTTIKKFTDENYFNKKQLTKNFRSCQPIVDLCQKLISSTEKIDGLYETILDKNCLCISFPKDKVDELPNWFSNYLKDNSLNCGKSKIVTRGWSTVSKLRNTGRSYLKQKQLWLATAIYLWKSGRQDVLHEAISLMGRFITKTTLDGYTRSSKNYYCPEIFESNTEWRLFLAKILDHCKKDRDISNLDETWENWAKTIRALLPKIIKQHISILKNFPTDELGNDIEFRAISGKARKKVSSTLDVKSSNDTDIQITTIHDVKGETLDAVMLVSSLSKSGTIDGHWEQWLEDPGSEAARLAYVASSRPQQLLVWAVPKLNENQKKRIEKIGFELIDLA